MEDLEGRLRRRAPLPFVEFMRLALYDPEDGYYVSRVPGWAAGHYTTSPALSPLFGRLVGRFLERLWEAAGHPTTWDVREVGPGGGELATGALREASGGFAEALRWTLVEPHERIEALQRRQLGSADADVRWVRSLCEAGAAPGCVVANEVLDNLPVHLLEVRDGELREGRVHASGDGLELRFDADPPPEVRAYVERYAGEPAEGQRLEVCSEALDWARETAAAVERGYLLVVDYGDEAPGLYERRPDGTLLAYASGQVTDDLLSQPGSRDLTAFVNVTALRDAATEAGLRHVGTTTQRELLLHLGLREELDRLRTQAAEADGVEALELHSARAAGAELARRGGMGDFAVLLMAKDAPDVELPVPRAATDFPEPPPTS